MERGSSMGLTPATATKPGAISAFLRAQLGYFTKPPPTPIGQPWQESIALDFDRPEDREVCLR